MSIQSELLEGEVFEKIPRRRTYVPHYTLDQLFDEILMADKLLLAESRIVTAFFFATEEIHGRQYRTYTYIYGVGKKQKDLVSHIFNGYVDLSGGHFITASELPKFVRDSEIRETAHRAEKQLVAEKLNQMIAQCDIWFNDFSVGTWEIVPSIIDKHRTDKQAAALVYKTHQRLRREKLHGGGRLRVVHWIE